MDKVKPCPFCGSIGIGAEISNEEKAFKIIGCDRDCLNCGGKLSVPNGCAEFRNVMEMARCKDEFYKLELDAKDQSIIQLEMSQFERIASVCRYRCAKIGDTYKCAHGKAFGESCTSKNCPILK